MCGICGWLNFDKEQNVDKTLLNKMNTTLLHRGPDGEGLYQGNNFAMGHRRLSIIDVATGQQPLCNEKMQRSGSRLMEKSTITLNLWKSSNGVTRSF